MKAKQSIFKQLLIVLTLSLFLTVSIVGLIGLWLISPVDPRNSQPETVVIPTGISLTRIGDTLESKGLIRHRLAFVLLAKYQGVANRIQAGTFKLAKNQNLFKILATLQAGSDDLWITITEGQRAEEIADKLAKELPSFSASDTAFRLECVTYEGQLYPETYLVPRLYNTTQICQMLRRQFAKEIQPLLESETAQATKFKPTELLTLASLVEREGRTETERRQVAGILLNRLNIGMPLQVDATLQYLQGKNSSTGEWWSTPSPELKANPSTYNTYVHKGLPPGPICNPSKQSVEAVLNPIESDNLYYLSSPDGQFYAAPTYEQHLINIERYLK